VAKKKPESRKIRVHSCFDIEAGELLPMVCACRQDVAIKTAQSMVGRGEADWVTFTEKKYEHSAVCLIAGLKRRTPRAATIDSKHIERAYVEGDLEERVRINTYGQLNRSMLRSLTTHISEEAFEAGKRDWGIPILSFIEDNRTPGGINKEKK
jgi:hypothetical protein